MATYTLYTAPGTCAMASHIALEEAGAPYQAITLDFKSGEQTKPAYKAINPKGRVPALITPRGTLTETPALLLFIAQTWPAAKLAPLDDPFRLAQVQAFNNYLCSTVHVAHAHGRRGSRWADDVAAHESMKRKVPQTMGDCYALIEAGFGDGPWVMGSEYTICDPYLYTISTWLEGDGVDPKSFPKVSAHMARMQERPAVQRVLAAG
jgi:glutathione S-transferase